jgi:hypothetical protein
MLTRVAQIGVYEQSSLANLGERSREISGEPASSFSAIWTYNRQYTALRAAEPPVHQLAAKCPYRFRERAHGVVADNNVFSHTTFASERERWKFELKLQRKFDIFFSQEPQLNGGSAEIHAVFNCKTLDLIHVART